MPRPLLEDLATVFRLEALALDDTDPEERDRLDDIADLLEDRAMTGEV